MTQSFADRIARAAPALAGTIFVAGLALVSALAFLLMRFNDTLRQSQAENLAERVVALVENEFAAISQIQITLAATLAKAPLGDAATYGAWLDQMGLVQRYPSLRVVAFAPRVDAADLAALHAKAAGDATRGALGYPDFAVQPPGPRDTMFPAYFVYPLAGNERVVGFDLWANPERRTAAERAIAAERPIGSAPMLLPQDNAVGTRSILAVLPIVAEGKTVGILPIGLSPGQLIEPLLEKQFPTARIAIHDRGADTAPGDARTRLPLLTARPCRRARSPTCKSRARSKSWAASGTSKSRTQASCRRCSFTRRRPSWRAELRCCCWGWFCPRASRAASAASKRRLSSARAPSKKRWLPPPARPNLPSIRVRRKTASSRT